MQLNRFNLGPTDIARISKAFVELSDENEIISVLEDCSLCVYQNDEQLLEDDFLEAISEIADEENMPVDLHRLKLLVLPDGVFAFLDMNDAFLHGFDICKSFLISNYPRIKDIAKMAISKYQAIEAELQLPHILMNELASQMNLELNKVQTSDNRHFYIDAPAGSFKFRFSDHTFAQGAGKLYGHQSPDVEVILPLTGNLDDLSSIRAQFFEKCRRLNLIN